MIKWLVNNFIKEHVDQLVDSRLNEKMFEKYYERRQNEFRQRINEVRQSLHSSSSANQEDKQAKLLPSSGIQTRNQESVLLSKADQTSIKRNADMDSIKAKLMRKNK